MAETLVMLEQEEMEELVEVVGVVVQGLRPTQRIILAFQAPFLIPDLLSVQEEEAVLAGEVEILQIFMGNVELLVVVVVGQELQIMEETHQLQGHSHLHFITLLQTVEAVYLKAVQPGLQAEVVVVVVEKPVRLAIDRMLPQGVRQAQVVQEVVAGVVAPLGL